MVESGKVRGAPLSIISTAPFWSRDGSTPDFSVNFSILRQLAQKVADSCPAMESSKAPKYCKSKNVDKLDIVRIASYHQREYDISVLRTDHDQVRSWLLRTISASSPTLGDVEPSPLEAILEICSILDIASLFNFRHVNHRALQIVIRTRGHEMIITHALRALYVILRTKIAPWFIISDLFKALARGTVISVARLVVLFSFHRL